MRFGSDLASTDRMHLDSFHCTQMIQLAGCKPSDYSTLIWYSSHSRRLPGNWGGKERHGKCTIHKPYWSTYVCHYRYMTWHCICCRSLKLFSWKPWQTALEWGEVHTQLSQGNIGLCDLILHQQVQDWRGFQVLTGSRNATDQWID